MMLPPPAECDIQLWAAMPTPRDDFRSPAALCRSKRARLCWLHATAQRTGRQGRPGLDALHLVKSAPGQSALYPFGNCLTFLPVMRYRATAAFVCTTGLGSF